MMTEKFVCKICEKILKTPVNLSCNCIGTICFEHITPLSKFQCPKCNKCYGEDECIENNSLKLLIEQCRYMKNDEERNLKETLEHIHESLLDAFQHLRFKFNEFSVSQYDHFANLKSDIDIQRETNLHKLYNSCRHTAQLHEISEQSAQMIRQVEKAEEKFRKNYMLTLKPKLDQMSNEINSIDLREYFRAKKN